MPGQVSLPLANIISLINLLHCQAARLRRRMEQTWKSQSKEQKRLLQVGDILLMSDIDNDDKKQSKVELSQAKLCEMHQQTKLNKTRQNKMTQLDSIQHNN